jgi:hypothetical protein
LVAKGVGGMSLETQQLAWLVLQTVNRTQAKGTTIRLVVPRDPEVARQLDPTLVEHELLAAEEYLLEQGYLAPTNLDLTWGTYTITPAGLEWLKEGLPDKEAAFDSTLRAELEEERSLLEEVERELDEESSGAPESAGEGQEKAEPRAATEGFQTATERRGLWSRLFGP